MLMLVKGDKLGFMRVFEEDKESKEKLEILS